MLMKILQIGWQSEKWVEPILREEDRVEESLSVRSQCALNAVGVEMTKGLFVFEVS